MKLNIFQKSVVYLGVMCLFFLPLFILDLTSGWKPSDRDFLQAANEISFPLFKLVKAVEVLEMKETKKSHYEAVVLSTHALDRSYYERIVFDDEPETSTYQLKFEKGTEITVLEFFETQPNRNGNGLERGGYSMRRVKSDIAKKDQALYMSISDFLYDGSLAKRNGETPFVYGSEWLADNYPEANLIN